MGDSYALFYVGLNMSFQNCHYITYIGINQTKVTSRKHTYMILTPLNPNFI